MITFSYSLQQLLTQRLITHQAVSTRTLPATLLEIPNCSSIRITRGFARASDLCDIYTTITLPCRSQHDWWNCVLWYVMRLCMKNAWKQKQFPFQHHLLINEKSKGIRQGFIIHNVCTHVTRTKQAPMTDSYLLLKATSYHQQHINTLSVPFFCCSYAVLLDWH